MTRPLVPAPPHRLDQLSLELSVWPAGQTLHHFYAIHRKPGSLNPGRGRGRFHPICRPDGKPIPTLYAAETPIGAAMETIFRTTAVGSVPRRVPRALLARYGLCQLGPQRPLPLINLAGNNLRRLGVVRAQLLEPGPRHYERTAAWAAALHAAYSNAGGLRWLSRQFDGAVSVLLFGDRVPARALRVSRDLGSCAQGDCFRLMLSIAHAADITVTEA